ncbi:MAG: hypothetical protein P4L50_15850, partial [Anaerolineaceae bacterium]|nr:hypothetical protein [Anaerolineaceae bacterium]
NPRLGKDGLDFFVETLSATGLEVTRRDRDTGNGQSPVGQEWANWAILAGASRCWDGISKGLNKEKAMTHIEPNEYNQITDRTEDCECVNSAVPTSNLFGIRSIQT